MKLVLFSLMVGLVAPSAPSQRPPDPDLAEMQEAMDKVSFLVGEWEGESTIGQNGETYALVGTETVESRVGGLALIVEGKHWAAGGSPERLDHHALAVITYDPKADHYWFRTQMSQGGHTDATGRIVDGAFRWSQKNARGEIRFTIQLNDDGEWIEIGEMSRDGEHWVTFFEMTMRRVK